jgi:hypothetical protein
MLQRYWVFKGKIIDGRNVFHENSEKSQWKSN